MKQLRKPEQYRLTLKPNAVHAFAQLMASQKPPRVGIGVSRPDGKYDVGISHALFDQLMTHSLPGENLSDTVVRVMSKESC
jgi:hypothetical protein